MLRQPSFRAFQGNEGTAKDAPLQNISFAKTIAHVGPGDPDAIASYPLPKMSARDLAGVLHVELPARDLDFFLEPFAL